jgi:hypothetical protein
MQIYSAGRIVTVTGFLVTEGPYNGTSQSLVFNDPDTGRDLVAYTDGQTLADYLMDKSGLRLVSPAELERLELAFVESLKTVTETTQAQWDHMLGCLPPADWGTFQGVEIFRLIEAQRGSLYSWFARVQSPLGERFFEVVEDGRAGHAKIAAKVQEALAIVPEDCYICLHPWFINDDGSQEHSDDRAQIDGWNVFTRRPCKVDGFSIHDDVDFATYEEAMAEAQRRAALTGFEIDEY